MAGGPERAWSLETARAMLADVRRCTEQAVVEAEGLLAELDEARGVAQRERLEVAIELRVSRWVREMDALGVVADGAWHVDFDTGSGCFCWRWPEPEILHFHGRDEGVEARMPIQ